MNGVHATRTLALFPFSFSDPALFWLWPALRFECSTRFKHLDFENYAGWGLGLGCVVGCCGREGRSRDWGGGGDGSMV